MRSRIDGRRGSVSLAASAFSTQFVDCVEEASETAFDSTSSGIVEGEVCCCCSCCSCCDGDGGGITVVLVVSRWCYRVGRSCCVGGSAHRKGAKNTQKSKMLLFLLECICSFTRAAAGTRATKFNREGANSRLSPVSPRKAYSSVKPRAQALTLTLPFPIHILTLLH